jgi:hypothetical protein
MKKKSTVHQAAGANHVSEGMNLHAEISKIASTLDVGFHLSVFQPGMQPSHR